MVLYKAIPAIHTWREAIFTGWFGPIGVGAVFYAMVAIESVSEDGPNAHARQMIRPVVYFMVLASVVAHGVTIPLFYIGTFATRTLTRTSEVTQILRIPKIDKRNIKVKRTSSDVEIDVVDIIPDNEEEQSTVDVQDTPKDEAPRHTAITILTPSEIPSRQNHYRSVHDNNRSAGTSSTNLERDHQNTTS